MAKVSFIKQSGPKADLVELLAFGVALTYGGDLWLHWLHYAAGLPVDWGHMLTEATIKLPLVLLVIWPIRAVIRAIISRRGAAMPRLAAGALVAVGMALAAFCAIVLDGMSTQLFYPELTLTGNNPFLCTVLSVGVEAATAIPFLGSAYDAVVTLPAMLIIAAMLVAVRPVGLQAQRAHL